MIPLDLSDLNYDNINPHQVRDGHWGGFGPSYWIRAERYGLGEWSVVEWHWVGATQKWWRIWIDEEKRWRGLLPEEVAKLPPFKPYVPFKASFDKPIAFPVASPEAIEAVAAVLTQPVLSVIEQAPILHSIFSTQPHDPTHPSS